MPPSGHSSSSRSSSSHSSSSRSSSRSSSSYSRSSSSSRSSSYSRSSSSSRPSSHSSSSARSSYSRSSYSAPRSYGGASGPSARSASSRSSTPRAAAPQPPRRTRVNQPSGYVPIGHEQPSTLFGLRHEYVYYPAPWTDGRTGVSYESGYYDENGARYEDVSFMRDGRYENVHCHCPYCGSDAILTLDAASVGVQSLDCPSCGAPMEIRSQLDEAAGGFGTSVPESGTGVPLTHEYAPYVPKQKKKSRRPLVIVLFLAALLAVFGARAARKARVELPLPSSLPIQTTESGRTEAGSMLGFTRSGMNSYLPASGDGADKLLSWDAAEESYYDAESDCWLWFNEDAGCWQYWYEGISSDYGDYGWMEHDREGWFIESSAGNWISLPARYDSARLWFVGLDETVTLTRSGEGRYTLSAAAAGDKTLVWDAAEESYYDAESDCWLWYNEDVEPAVWQYWFEGVSSDFGDWGWMEHYDDGWFIEASAGNWVSLPAQYDSSALWYIEG